MKYKVFIDGKEGTTGLQIFDRFKNRNDIELIEISEELRKDLNERKKCINSSDITFLCLPDQASIEAVSLLENKHTKIIDASRKAGLSSKVGASDTWESAALVASSSASAEGAIFASFFNEGSVGTTETTKFNKEAPGYLSFNGFSSTITSNLACGYDAYMAIYRALENMDKLDNEELRFRIDDLNYDGLTGVIKFDENGDAIINTIYMKEIINKRFALLETTSIN